MPDYDRQTGLVVVDVQNDFAHPAGSLYVSGGDSRVVPAVNREVVTALASGAGVYYTQDWHPEMTPHFDVGGGVWRVHCVAGTWGAEFHPQLLLAGPVVRKGVNGEDGFSGFTMQDPESGETIPTPLAGMLREAGHTQVVVVGLTLDYCVRATALDAVGQGFATTVPLHTTAAVNLSPGDGDRAVAQLQEAGVVVF